MKVLFFIPSTRHYLDRVKLLIALSARLEKFTLLIGNNDSHIKDDSCNIIDLGCKRGKFINNRLLAARTAKSILCEDHYDIVHDTFGFLLPLFFHKDDYPGTLFISSLFKWSRWTVKHIWKTRDLFRLCTSNTARMYVLNSLIEIGLAKKADYVVLQSPGAYSYILDVLPIEQSRLEWLPNNVDTDYWTPGNKSMNDIPGKHLRIFNVGGGAISKGALILVQVLHRLRAQGIPVILTHVGGLFARDRRRIQNEIERLGVAKWITFVDRVDRYVLRDLYRECDLFLYQTINDGSPRVVLEALACGLPVVASHHPGIDVIDPEEKFISFTEFGDVEEAVDKILHINQHRSLMSNISCTGRAQVEKDFSNQAVADRYIRLYDKVIAKKTSCNKVL